MRKKVYHLSTCSTNQRIIKELRIGDEFEYQDIKTQSITPAQIEEMHTISGTYEALFSRRAMKFRARGLHEKQLSEADYKALILEEYTFLKRPVFLIGEKIFIGNAKKTVAQVSENL